MSMERLETEFDVVLYEKINIKTKTEWWKEKVNGFKEPGHRLWAGERIYFIDCAHVVLCKGNMTITCTHFYGKWKPQGHAQAPTYNAAFQLL